jgi:uncharacterized membrane protein
VSTLQLESPAAEGDVFEAGPPVNRMIMAVLALAGLVIATYMLLYKLGVLPAVACGNGACEVVQASPWAVFIGVPVPLIGVLGYGLLLGLALAGVQPRFAQSRRVGVALFAFAAIAFGFSVYLSWVEATLIGAWCRWCIGSAVVATGLFLCSIPEVRRARTPNA